MDRQLRRYALTAWILTLLAALSFVSAAAAEVRIGYATSPADETLRGDLDILSASASYDSTVGTVTFIATTREPFTAGRYPLWFASMGTVESPCENKLITHPSVGITAEIGLLAFWEATDGEGEVSGQARSSASGATVTLTAEESALASKPYNCVAITVDGESESDRLEFPVAPTPASVISTPISIPAPVASPAPAQLSIARPSPLRSKAEEWKRAQILISNPGGSATTTGSVSVKAPQGVALKPGEGKLKLPPLQPGQIKTLSFRVKLTRAARAKSKLSLTAKAGTLAASSSIVAKLIG